MRFAIVWVLAGFDSPPTLVDERSRRYESIEKDSSCVAPCTNKAFGPFCLTRT